MGEVINLNEYRRQKKMIEKLRRCKESFDRFWFSDTISPPVVPNTLFVPPHVYKLYEELMRGKYPNFQPTQGGVKKREGTKFIGYVSNEECLELKKRELEWQKRGWIKGDDGGDDAA